MFAALSILASSAVVVYYVAIMCFRWRNLHALARALC